MAKIAQQHVVRPRDLEILAALDRTQLTALQLLKLSRTFVEPIGSERMVRERLQALCDAGWVRWAQYATTSQGAAPKYYFLSPTGYAIIYGPDVAAPPKRSFARLPITLHRHSRALAEFVVHTVVAAHVGGIVLENYYRENSLRLAIDGESLTPDAAFELRTPDKRQWNFVVEVDCGTERVESALDADSWNRKIRLYDRLLDLNYPHRFRVLVVCTAGPDRLAHILRAANKLLRNPLRALLYGVSLDDYLAQPDPLRAACFRDHAERPVALVR
jgi:hypothetical protein